MKTLERNALRWPVLAAMPALLLLLPRAGAPRASPLIEPATPFESKRVLIRGGGLLEGGPSRDGPVLFVELVNVSGESLRVGVAFGSPPSTGRCDTVRVLPRDSAATFECPQAALAPDVPYAFTVTAFPPEGGAPLESGRARMIFGRKDTYAVYRAAGWDSTRVPEIPQDRARIGIAALRTGSGLGILVDRQPIGVLDGPAFLSFEVAAGEHLLWSPEASLQDRFTFRGGRRYFLLIVERGRDSFDWFFEDPDVVASTVLNFGLHLGPAPGEAANGLSPRDTAADLRRSQGRARKPAIAPLPAEFRNVKYSETLGSVDLEFDPLAALGLKKRILHVGRDSLRHEQSARTVAIPVAGIRAVGFAGFHTNNSLPWIRVTYEDGGTLRTACFGSDDYNRIFLTILEAMAGGP